MSLSDIHTWRLNFVNEAIDSRFDAIGHDVQGILYAEAEDFGIKLPKGGFMAAIQPLKRRWMQLSAPASIAGLAG